MSAYAFIRDPKEIFEIKVRAINKFDNLFSS